MSIQPDLNKLLQVLLENNIDFIIIGGFAGVLHGSTVVTRDLDICMLMKPKTLERLREILTRYNPKHRRGPSKISFVEIPKSFEGIKNLYLETDLGVLDILEEVIGVGTFNELVARSIKLNLFNHIVKVISMDDLIASKKAMGRPKDLLVVTELQKILNKSLS